MELRDVVILHWLSPTGQCYTWLWGRLTLHPGVWFLCLVYLCCSWIVTRYPDDRASCVPPKISSKPEALGRGEPGPAHGSAGTSLQGCSRACPFGDALLSGSTPRIHNPSWRSHNPQVRSAQGHPVLLIPSLKQPLEEKSSYISFISDCKDTEIFSSSNIFPVMLLWEVP